MQEFNRKPNTTKGQKKGRKYMEEKEDNNMEEEEKNNMEEEEGSKMKQEDEEVNLGGLVSI